MLDDLVVVVLGVDLFFDGIPAGILDEKLGDLGIDRAAFDRDLGQVRRLTPSPVRRLVRRLPPAVDAAAGPPRLTPRATGPGTHRQGGFVRVKVILTGDVAKLGKSGEMKVVTDGYARNFLIPEAGRASRGRRLSRLAARRREPRGQAAARA